MREFLKLLFVIFLTCNYYLLTTNYVFAQDFRNDYQVEYYLSKNQKTLNTRVKFNIQITNLKSDVYVKQFSISFPQSFLIHDIKASDDHIAIDPQIASTNNQTKISLEFSNANVGKNSVNNFYLEFSQDNLFSVNGNVWEVIIPTVEDKKNSNYKIIVNLPAASDKKISIAKPKPDLINGDQIVWTNPSAKTIYAVFGDIQYYKADLTFHLKNSQLIPVYTDVAFPPDTLYQKVFVDDISPKPAKVYHDEDGNYLGRYYLNPSENKTVTFKGTIAELSQPREEIIPYVKNNINNQKSYLLSETKYWTINQLDKIKALSGKVQDIYYFVTNTLQYNYQKINSNNVRLGADKALISKNMAVCMEFTDLFIATAREKGIFSREIEGYGFSQDARIRPLTLNSDILHSWPEFYDINSSLWVPVDPTWENTSGIDYFNAFDLNHITFVIHGNDPQYPLPAGTYKIGNSHDVALNVTAEKPKEIRKVIVNPISFPKKINDRQIYQIRFNIQNTGNIYLWDKPLAVKTTNLTVNPSVLTVSPLAPYETKEILLTYKAATKNQKTKASIQFTLPDNKMIKAEMQIVPFYYDLALKSLSVCL